MFTRLKSNKGSVTVEATIALTAFMFAIITILTIVNICMVQARISIAINTVAKEMSQYSYLYALTGFNKSEEALAQAGQDGTQDINSILSDVNTVFNEIGNIGNTAGDLSTDNTADISTAWEDAVGSAENIQNAGSSLESTIMNIASDPKQLIYGIAKLAASESMELAKSKLIAGPLAKAMSQRHLVDSKGGNTEDYLKGLGVIPSASGSYLDGLDFSNSTIFPYGSSEITIDVTYDVKVIALLPLDFKFHFHQRAATHGWLCGEVSFKSVAQYSNTDSIWTNKTVQERVSDIRSKEIADMLLEGYQKTSGLTDVQLYNPETNEFVMISSMNPLYSPEGEPALSVSDLNADTLKASIETLCGKMNSTTDGLTTVKTKTETNGQTTKTDNDCSNASNTIVLVIPEDPGLQEAMEKIIAESNTNGVNIVLQPDYGNGANQTLVP